MAFARTRHNVSSTTRRWCEPLETRRLFSTISGTTYLSVVNLYGTGISGMTVYLDLNANDQLDTGEPSAVSTPNYRFENLAAGTYRVRQIPKPGYRNRSDYLDGGTRVVEATPKTPGKADFGYVPLDELYGVSVGLAEDLNGDGQFQWPAENLAGWDIFVDANLNGVHDPGEIRRTTGKEGIVFQLPFGTHRFQQVMKSGWAADKPSTGYVEATLGNVPQNAKLMWNVRLVDDQFGSIQGTVFDDANRNGTLDSGEAGTAGATVFLDTNLNGVADSGERTATSATTGDFAFGKLNPGSYRIGVMKAGYIATNLFGSDQTIDVTNAKVSTASIGLRPADKGEIRGVVFEDKDGNRTRNAGEEALLNWAVYLDVNNNTRHDSGEPLVRSTADGYAFTAVASGTHYVRLLATSNLTSPTTGTHVVILTTDETVQRDFGVRWVPSTPGENPSVPPPVTTVPPPVPPPAEEPTLPTLGTISGYFFDDLNFNGTQDSGEMGVRGSRVFIDINQNGKLDRREPRRKTGDDGFYGFTDLPSGTFAVSLNVGRGHRLSFSDGVEYVELEPGAHVALNVAATRTGQVSGVLHEDSNGNRRLDAGDAAIPRGEVFVDINGNRVKDDGEPTAIADELGRFSIVAGSGIYRIFIASSEVPLKLKIATAKLLERNLLFRLGDQ